MLTNHLLLTRLTNHLPLTRLTCLPGVQVVRPQGGAQGEDAGGLAPTLALALALALAPALALALALP